MIDDDRTVFDQLRPNPDHLLVACRADRRFKAFQGRFKIIYHFQTPSCGGNFVQSLGGPQEHVIAQLNKIYLGNWTSSSRRPAIPTYNLCWSRRCPDRAAGKSEIPKINNPPTRCVDGSNLVAVTVFEPVTFRL